MDAGDEKERKRLLGECFNERAIHLNEEGLVVKDLYGHYMVCVCCCWGRAGGVDMIHRYRFDMLTGVWFVVSRQRSTINVMSSDAILGFHL